ncbi:MAG: exodeoxyribonuclease VII large subunit [Deltaproteobacteria bacterium]|nr:MAG: exodeoxyribonuclease VII large subunit [Deltaproteobacteria bacterium]
MEPDLFDAPDAGAALSVSELTARIKRSLETSFRLVRVEGEVSNYKWYEASGHRYFSLKDEGAQIRVVLFRGNERRIFGEIRDGQTVIVTGSLGVYEKKGEYQLYARSAEVRGVGNLLVELERRKRALAEEGLFDPARKRPLPPFPRKLGIVTSRHGAALRDMVRVARSRFPGVSIVLAPSLVQGAGAAADIAAALDAMYRHGGADVVIAGRGGGSIEDLWAFNEEEVVRAIARSPVPTISAVGHETDFTLADLVADHRAPTPTAAAQMAVPDRVELLERIAGLALRLRRADARTREAARQEWRIVLGKLSDPRPLLQGKRYALAEQQTSLGEFAKTAVRDRRERVERLSVSVRMRSPSAWVSAKRALLDHLHSRAVAGSDSARRGRRSSADLLAGKLAAMDPRAVLARGYSIAVDRATGKAIRSVSETRSGQPLDVQVADGAFGAVVEGRKS